ncbi:unnamed protein product, partial [Rotaria sordida]
ELTVQKPAKKEPGLIENIKSKIMSSSYVQNYILQQAQKKVMSQTQGLYPAPLKILDVIKQTLESGSKVGYNAEADVSTFYLIYNINEITKQIQNLF